MPHLRRASFAGDDEVSIRAIRTTVFCEEQGVDPAIDFDGNDASAIHVLVSCIGEPVATGRVLQRGPAAYVYEGRWPEDGEPL